MNDKRTAPAHFAFDRDRAVVGFDDAPGDCQPNAAALFAPPFSLSGIKVVEDVGQVFRGYSNSVI